jgi:hypothetical protein
MRRSSQLRLCSASLCAALTLAIVVSADSASAEWQLHVSARVLDIWKSSQTQSSMNAAPVNGAASGAMIPGSPGARFDANGRVQIDVAFDCSQSAPTQALVTAGLIVGTTVKVPPMCVVQGWAPPSVIPTLALVPGVQRIDLPRYTHHRPVQPPQSKSMSFSQQLLAAGGTPAIDGNGIAIMETDKYVAQTGVNGTGVTMAIISDDVESLSVIQGRGELPASVNVVQPSTNPTRHQTLTDEGTMMLEEAYAVAPGASLAFCGPESSTEYVACVQNLIAAGATVISDDIGYPFEDVMSLEGVTTQAIANLLKTNSDVMLFTAAGNNAPGFWQGTYAPVRFNGTLSCNGQTDNYLQSWGTNLISNQWTVGSSNSPLVALTWPNPTGKNTSNYDLYAFDANGKFVGCSNVNQSNYFGTSGTTSYLIIPEGAVAPGTYQLAIGTPDASLSGGFLKLIYYTDSNGDKLSVITPGGTYTPQALAAGDFTVGAVDGGDRIGRNIEPFSNRGPIQVELPTPSMLQSPVAVAPDDVYVDAVGTDFPAANGAFFGTSAASPNMAAVAVLLRSAFSSLTPTQTINAMKSGAAPLASPIPNGSSGYGRVDALGALAALPVPAIGVIGNQTITGGTAAQIALTLNGTGALSLTGSSDNASLISVGSGGDISVSPSTCGTSTDSCSLVIQPTLGQLGTAHITIGAADGAMRTAKMQFAVTVVKPAPPSISVTSGDSQSFAPGGMPQPVNFTLTGTLPLNVAINNSNPSLTSISLNSACGTSTLSCTATLAVTSGQTGSSTLTLTASDPYAQTATATATLAVGTPAKGGGGGSLDLLTLLALGSCWLLRQHTSRSLVSTS